MDKILELLIKYFEDKVEIIDICKKEKIDDKYKFICIYKVYKYVYITLFIFFILGLFISENEVLKEISIFSFYTIIVISFLGFISLIGYKEEEEENSNAKEKMKSLIEDLIKDKKNNIQKIILNDIQDKFEKDFEEYTDPRKRIRITLQKLAKDGFLERETNGVYKIKR